MTCPSHVTLVQWEWDCSAAVFKGTTIICFEAVQPAVVQCIAFSCSAFAVLRRILEHMTVWTTRRAGGRSGTGCTAVANQVGASRHGQSGQGGGGGTGLGQQAGRVRQGNHVGYKRVGSRGVGIRRKNSRLQRPRRVSSRLQTLDRYLVFNCAFTCLLFVNSELW